MPTIESRRNKDASLTWRVRWRESADYRPTYTFNTNEFGARAERFAQTLHDLVAASGERLPTREQLAAYQLDWILGPVIESEVSAAPAGIVTVAEATRRYLDWLGRSVKAPEARTLKDYEGYLRRDIGCRAIGALDVATCQFEDIDAWQEELLTTVGPYGRAQLSPQTVRKIRLGVLTPMFTFAGSVRSGRPPLRLLSSPLQDSELPEAGPAFQRDILETPDEYELFIRIAYAMDPDWTKLVTTAAATGLRLGESTQLGPASVHPRRHTLRVTDRFSAGNIESGRKNGDAGTVPVPEWVTSRILVPALDRGGPYLFTGPSGGRWSYATESRRWATVRERLRAEGLNIKLTNHCLRKGYRTWLSSKKIESPKIDVVMGHRTPGIRGVYTDLTAADRAEIREAITTLIPESVWPGR